MQAKFYWPGLEVEIDNCGPQVVLSLKHPERAVVSGDMGKIERKEVIEPEQHFVAGLDKTTARSIASALMGAAAEL